MIDREVCRAAVFFVVLFSSATAVWATTPSRLSEEQAAAAAANYQQYCVLCHGEDRQGHANDHAPSLRSQSLMTSGRYEMALATAYGRLGTPMAAYLDEMGGPMTIGEIRQLIEWLRGHTVVDAYTPTYDPVLGDIELGEAIYSVHCASCHGKNGEGGTGTALGNPAMLSLTTDKFIRYAIEHGRDGTEMVAFREILSSEEIDSVTAFLRSRATGWTVDKPALRSPPDSQDYVINPDSPAAEFYLEDGLYVSSPDLLEALQENRRMVLLDTRSMSQWQVFNIEGSVPIPYYTDYNSIGDFLEDLPDDGTMIVTYCECPRAAAERVNTMIREQGFTNTAVLWEGIRGWVSLGYPVFRGKTSGNASTAVKDTNQRDDNDDS
ncbi:MAG: c-type cytochrome [Pseudomonadota bacterium]